MWKVCNNIGCGIRITYWLALIVGCYLFLPRALETQARPSARSTPVGEPDIATSIRLKYAVFDSRGDFMPCGPAFFQNRESNVQAALNGFSVIQSNPAVHDSIARHLNLNPAALDDDERVLIYCEYQKLQSIRLEPWRDKYRVINVTTDHPSGDSDSSSQGWTSVDTDGRVMSLSVQTLTPVTSGPLRDMPPAPPAVEPKITITRVELPRLRYQALDRFPNPNSCAPLFENLRQEIAAFPEIQNDAETFTEIKRHLKLTSVTDFSDAQKRLVYWEYHKLQSMPFDLLVSKYQFRSGPYIGIIDPMGKISLLRMLRIGGCPL